MREKTQISYVPSLSSLPLQVTLHFNVLFSIMYLILIGATCMSKVLYYNKKVAISSITVWVCFEVVRLYYGMSGNMNEKVPELSAYLLITIFPQIPFALYFAYIQPVLFPVDPILGTFMLLLLLFQIWAGLITTRKLIRNQTAQFMRLCDTD
jgi:transmembrane protein 17